MYMRINPSFDPIFGAAGSSPASDAEDAPAARLGGLLFDGWSYVPLSTNDGSPEHIRNADDPADKAAAIIPLTR